MKKLIEIVNRAHEREMQEIEWRWYHVVLMGVLVFVVVWIFLSAIGDLPPFVERSFVHIGG